MTRAKNMMHGRMIILGIAAALGASLACAAQADLIRLKPAATVEVHQDVHLGDIANVTGDDPVRVEALANTVIIAGAEKSGEIKIDDILMAVISQGGSTATEGSLQVGGAPECQINVGAARQTVVRQGIADVDGAMGAMQAVAPQPAPKPASVQEKPAAAPAVKSAPLDDTATLSQLITARVQKELGVSADDMTIRFDSISPLIDHPPVAGTKWLCRPLTRTFLGTVVFEAQLVQGTKVLDKLNVQTTVQQLKWVPVATARLSRGDVVTADVVQMQRLPLDRKMPTLFTSEKDVIGLESQKDLEPGTMLDNRDFGPAYMAHKNEPITVIYVAGALQVQMRGRSMGDAKLHEQVQIRNESTGEQYNATVVAKDVAVAGGTLTAEQEKQLREGMQ